jgi:hypothetical protein
MRLAKIVVGDINQLTGGHLYQKKLVDSLRRTGQHAIVPLGIDEDRCGSSTLGLTCLKSQEKIRGSESPLKILFEGSVVPNKGLHLLIDEMSQPHTQLVVLDVLGNAAVSCGYQRRLKKSLGALKRIQWFQEWEGCFKKISEIVRAL